MPGSVGSFAVVVVVVVAAAVVAAVVRVSPRNHHDHWVFNFVARNLNRITALTVLRD